MGSRLRGIGNIEHVEWTVGMGNALWGIGLLGAKCGLLGVGMGWYSRAGQKLLGSSPFPGNVRF
jgi:hypothetical protein